MDLNQWVIDLRREFHRFAEPGFAEHRTAGRVEQVLQELGIETRRVAGTGVVGTLVGGRPGKTVALRADMDALEQTELTGKDYASQSPGIQHACGHDAHTAGLLGAARVLATGRDELSGRVVFLFQPAEELASGAKAMIEAGALAGVDAIFGMHVFGQMPVGTVGVRSGPMLAGGDQWKITFRGKGGHAAMPFAAVDSLGPACQTLLGLQALVTKEFDIGDRLVITAGQLHGGTRFNIVPGEAWLEGTVRYFRREIAGEVREKMTRLAEATANAYRNTVEVRYEVMIPPTINEPGAAKLARAAAVAAYGERAVVDIEPVMGSEDFAFFLAEVPGAFLGVGCGNPAKGIVYPNHHPQFDIDEDALGVLTRLHVEIARSFLAQ
jgi:amidohydrolase